MGDFFNKMAGGVEKAQAGFLGPTYNYAKQIKSPSELGMSSDGNMGALARDVAGIIAYTDVLVGGNCTGPICGQRQDTPLGNQFYLKTGGQCKSDDGQPRDRWLYINNVPTGSIPFLSNMSGQNLPGLRGLVPGTMENLGQINPLALFGGFMQGTTPPCSILKLKDVNGTMNSTRYVANADIASLEPCLFGGTNPISKVTKGGCASGFENMNDIMTGIKNRFDGETPGPGATAQIYNAGFSVLLLYLMYHLVRKSGD